MNIVSLDFFFLEVSFVIYILLKIIHFYHNLNLISMELSRVISYDHKFSLQSLFFPPLLFLSLCIFVFSFLTDGQLNIFYLICLSPRLSVSPSLLLSGCKEPAQALLVLSFLNHQFIFYVY